MARPASKIILTEKDRTEVQTIVNARTSGVCYVDRARMILMKADGRSSEDIAKELEYNRKSVDLWVNRYLNRPNGIAMKDLLRDAKGRGRKRDITGDARLAVKLMACTNPKQCGLAEELWSKRSLAKALRKKSDELGLPRLAKIGASTVYRILEEDDIQPWRSSITARNAIRSLTLRCATF